MEVRTFWKRTSNSIEVPYTCVIWNKLQWGSANKTTLRPEKIGP